MKPDRSNEFGIGLEIFRTGLATIIIATRSC